MIAASDLELLQADLGEECRELDRLQEAMQREQAAITAGEAETITECARQKEAHMDCLAELAGRRKALLSEGGFRDGMAGLLKTLPDTDKMHAEWRRVQARARQAEQLNRASGILLRLHAAQLNARIGAFMSAFAPAATYSPAGKYSLDGRRTLGAA